VSTYITDVDPITLDARMRARDIITLDYFEALPECCFIREHLDAAMKALAAGEPDKHIQLLSFEWTQTGSAMHYESLLIKKIGPKIMGKVEAIFTWEEGEWQTGLIIEDGKVTECEVERKLLRPKKRR